MQTFIGLLTALLGSAGFALIFNVRKQLLPLAALGGAVCWGTYLLAGVRDGVCFSAVLRSQRSQRRSGRRRSRA